MKKRVMDTFDHILAVVMAIAIVINAIYARHGGRHELRNYVVIIAVTLTIGVAHALRKRSHQPAHS